MAVRHDRDVISAHDLDEARDRILLGRRDASNALLPEEKHSVAVHESGHALVALLSDHADPVAKITILPAGRALGVTEQLPADERHLYSESYLLASLDVRLGGRASEILVLGEASTGASNDLAGATGLAINMVRDWGLSPRLGPVGFSSDGPGYLDGPAAVPEPALLRRHPAGHRRGGEPAPGRSRAAGHGGADRPPGRPRRPDRPAARKRDHRRGGTEAVVAGSAVRGAGAADGARRCAEGGAGVAAERIRAGSSDSPMISRPVRDGAPPRPWPSHGGESSTEWTPPTRT